VLDEAPLKRHRWAAKAFSAAVLAGSASASAAPPTGPVALAWTRSDPTCIAEEDLANTVERTLARPIFQGGTAAIATVTGTIGEVEPGRFQAHITLTDKAGARLSERVLETDGDCERLDESVAVVVALMIDSLEVAPAPLVIPPKPLHAPLRATEATPRPPSFTVALALGASVSSSFLPGVRPAAVLRGEVAARRFVPVGLTMRAHAPAQSLVDGSGGTFTSWSGEISACPTWAATRLRLGVCGGIGGGLMAGSAIGLTDGQNPVRPLVIASLLPYGALRLTPPFWVRAEAGAWFPLLRESWGYLDRGVDYVEVHRPAVVVPTAGLAFEIRTGS
jgi:hypothetical protein